MHSVENVLIVGAGMCGMSLGVALRRTGINCEIVEIRPELTETGTGISLQGHALRALQAVGVLDQCISRGFGYSHFKACDAMGNVTGTVDLPQLLGANYPATIGILRQSVHEVLAQELSDLGVPIRLSTTVNALTQDDRGNSAIHGRPKLALRSGCRRGWNELAHSRPCIRFRAQAALYRSDGLARHREPTG